MASPPLTPRTPGAGPSAPLVPALRKDSTVRSETSAEASAGGAPPLANEDSVAAPGTPPRQTPPPVGDLSPDTAPADAAAAAPVDPELAAAATAKLKKEQLYHRVVWELNQDFPNAQYTCEKLVLLLKDIVQLMHVTATKKTPHFHLPKEAPCMFCDYAPKGSVFRLALRCYYIRGTKVTRPIEFSAPQQQSENLSILKAVRAELSRKQEYFHLSPRDQLYLHWLKQYIEKVTGPLEVERRQRGVRFRT